MIIHNCKEKAVQLEAEWVDHKREEQLAKIVVQWIISNQPGKIYKRWKKWIKRFCCCRRK